MPIASGEAFKVNNFAFGSHALNSGSFSETANLHSQIVNPNNGLNLGIDSITNIEVGVNGQTSAVGHFTHQELPLPSTQKANGLMQADPAAGPEVIINVNSIPNDVNTGEA